MSLQSAQLAIMSLVALASLAAAQPVGMFELSDWFVYRDARYALTQTLTTASIARLAERASAIPGNSSADAAAWHQRQATARAALEKVNKLLIESRPGFFVSSALYVPEPVPTRAPGIIFTSGHTASAFRANASDEDDYQIVQLNLVARGYVVLAIDPIGQGERDQYFPKSDPTGFFHGPTTQHEYLAQQLELNGVAAMSFWLWDEQVALDYLASLPFVDSSKLGVAGCSGGGTQASYLGAMDTRIEAASIACYTSTFRIDRMFTPGGGSDGEQTWPHGVAMYLDKPDLLEVRAPRPTQALITTDDQDFPAQGGRDAVAEAAQAFSALGAPLNLVVNETTWHHGYVQPNREALYSFFCSHLAAATPHPNCSHAAEFAIPEFSHEQLWATTTGQVVTDPAVASKTVWNFTADMTRANLAEIATRRAQGSAAMVTFVRNVSLPLAGFVSPARPAPPAVFLGNQKAFPGAFSHVAEARKHVLSGEGVCLVPTVVYLPHNVSAAVPAPAVMLVARKAGSALSPALTSLVDAFAGAGYVVVVPDLCGFGEAGDAFTTTSFGKGAGGCEQMATELGRSVAGIHAADVQRAAAHALALPEVSALAATVALDHTMTAVLLASFLGGDARPALGRLALVAPVASFSENARGEGDISRALITSWFLHADAMQLSQYYNYTAYYSWMFGVLKSYDLCDLAAAADTAALLVVAPTDSRWAPLDAAAAKEAFAFTAKAFADTDRNWQLNTTAIEPDAQEELLLRWARQT